MISVAFLHRSGAKRPRGLGTISVKEEQSYILRVREHTKACCGAWLAAVGGSSGITGARSRLCLLVERMSRISALVHLAAQARIQS